MLKTILISCVMIAPSLCLGRLDNSKNTLVINQKKINKMIAEEAKRMQFAMRAVAQDKELQMNHFTPAQLKTVVSL